MTATETRQTITVPILGPDDAPLVAEIRVLTGTVEVWVGDRLDGTFDRERLAAWLVEPHRPIVSTSVTLSLDLNLTLVIYLPNVPTWVRAPTAERQLRDLL